MAGAFFFFNFPCKFCLKKWVVMEQQRDLSHAWLDQEGAWGRLPCAPSEGTDQCSIDYGYLCYTLIWWTYLLPFFFLPLLQWPLLEFPSFRSVTPWATTPFIFHLLFLQGNWRISYLCLQNLSNERNLISSALLWRLTASSGSCFLCGWPCVSIFREEAQASRLLPSYLHPSFFLFFLLIAQIN